MVHRAIGQEQLGFAVEAKTASSLDALSALVDWAPRQAQLSLVHASATGEAEWPPLAMFKALVLGRLVRFIIGRTLWTTASHFVAYETSPAPRGCRSAPPWSGFVRH